MDTSWLVRDGSAARYFNTKFMYQVHKKLKVKHKSCSLKINMNTELHVRSYVCIVSALLKKHNVVPTRTVNLKIAFGENPFT